MPPKKDDSSKVPESGQTAGILPGIADPQSHIAGPGGFANPLSGEFDQPGGQYPGTVGYYEPGEAGRCQDRLCSCLGGPLQYIGAMLYQIARILEARLKSPCDSIDGCIDKILDKLKQRLEGPARSCEECKAMAAGGLAGTLEYAVQCAGACLEETAAVCSLGSPETWGKPCDTCGEPCCVCVAGVCTPTPCGEEEPPEEEFRPYIAWCDPLTGLVAVSGPKVDPPGGHYTRVGFSETEEAAVALAQANCQRAAELIPSPSSVQPINAHAPLCNFASFQDGSALASLSINALNSSFAAGAVQANQAITKFGFDGITVGSVLDIAKGTARALWGGPTKIVEEVVPILAGSLGCSNSAWAEGIMLLANIGTVERATGGVFTDFTAQIKYAMNVACRMKWLTPDQALAAYLGDAIDYSKLDTQWAMGGLCNDALNWTLKAARAKPVPLQLAFMRRRRLIDVTGYNVGMRELGYLDNTVKDQLFKLTEQVPPMSDIIRFMVRDAGDESPAGPVHRFNLDALFDVKYGQLLRDWGEFQGIPEDVARYNWRAHWTIPAPSQLFTFYHRLRHNAAFGNVLEDVKQAMIQQDILPFWHQHFLETSFRPLGRVDIRRAFNIGALQQDEIFEAYVQLGYSDAVSNKLTAFSIRLRDDSAVGHKAIKLWLKFALTRSEASARMVSGGLPGDVVSRALDDASFQFASTPLAAAFVRGELNRDEFTNRLQNVGVDQNIADKVADSLGFKISKSPALDDFVVGTIDESAAVTEMVAQGIPQQIADNLLRQASRHLDRTFLIACQRGIKRKYLMGELTADESRNELLTRGTSQQRANQLVEWWGCEKSSAGKAVATNKLCEWLERGAIDAGDFLQRLRRIGYEEIDAARILEDCLSGINARQAARARKAAMDEAARIKAEQAALTRANALIARALAQQTRAVEAANRLRAARNKQLYSASGKVQNKCNCDLDQAVQTVKNNHSRIQREYGFSVDESLQLLILAAEAWDGGELDTYAESVNALAAGATKPPGDSGGPTGPEPKPPRTNGRLHDTETLPFQKR